MRFDRFFAVAGAQQHQEAGENEGNRTDVGSHVQERFGQGLFHTRQTRQDNGDDQDRHGRQSHPLIFVKRFRFRRQFVDIHFDGAGFLHPGPAAHYEEAADVDEALRYFGVEVNLPGQGVQGHLFGNFRQLRRHLGDDAVGNDTGRGKRGERRAIGGANDQQGHQERRHADAGSDRHGDRRHQGATGDVARSDGGNEGDQDENNQGNDFRVAFAHPHGIGCQFFHGAVGPGNPEQERNTDQDHEQAEREGLHNFGAGHSAPDAADDDSKTDGQITDVQIFIDAADDNNNSQGHNGHKCCRGNFHKP